MIINNIFIIAVRLFLPWNVRENLEIHNWVNDDRRDVYLKSIIYGIISLREISLFSRNNFPFIDYSCKNNPWKRWDYMFEMLWVFKIKEWELVYIYSPYRRLSYPEANWSKRIKTYQQLLLIFLSILAFPSPISQNLKVRLWNAEANCFILELYW